MSKEGFKPGDKVRVASCERNPESCTVSPHVVEREDDNVPLRGAACGCVRSPEKLELLALENQSPLQTQG